jgi:IrrE N-terminal-like domain
MTGGKVLREFKKTEDVLQEFKGRVIDFVNSEEWAAYQRFNNCFPQFDNKEIEEALNVMPTATMLLDKETWQSLNRIVVDGQEPVILYRGTPMYDVQQTEGDNLPEVVSVLQGAAPKGAYRMLRQYAKTLGFKVVESKTELPEQVNGQTEQMARRILINANKSPKQKLKTLAHEIFHAKYHREEFNRAKAEVEAETAAFLMCRALGVDTSDYSVGYVASWAAEDEGVLDRADEWKIFLMEETVKSLLEDVAVSNN